LETSVGIEIQKNTVSIAMFLLSLSIKRCGRELAERIELTEKPPLCGRIKLTIDIFAFSIEAPDGFARSGGSLHPESTG